ncbi:MAG: DUF1697 domain-containing protein [Planctomycetota bacterium]
MSLHVALLRAINVAGRNKVGMADLRALFESLGYAGAKTLLQSGNVVFDTGKAKLTGAKLEARLEAATAAELKVTTDYVVRTAAEWSAIVAANPYPKEAAADPGHLVLMPLKAAPTAAAVKSLQAAIKGKGRETVTCVGRDLFLVYPDGIGRSKLTNAMIEKHVETIGTGRNWNTVLKLEALLQG